MNSTRTSQAWLKATESFLVSLTHSWHFSVMVRMPDYWSVYAWVKSHKSLKNITIFFVIQLDELDTF